MIRLAPPVDVERFRPAARPLPQQPSRPRAIAVGRLVHQKGIDTLLHAWRLLLDGWSTGPAPELLVLGDGPRRVRLERLAATLGVAGQVRLAGAVPREQVLVELQRADVFALPMRTRWAGLNPEGLGLAAIEAAACGLPVVVGASGGAPETVQPGRSGFVVEPGDVRALAARLTELLGDPGRARAMGAAGREHVSARFGSDQARATLRTALRLS